MIEIPWDPTLHIGPIALAWHGIFTALGILAGVMLTVRLLRGKVSEDDVYAIATWGVIAGLIGARALHVIDRWDDYAANRLQIFAIWTGGIAVWGAIVGGVLGGAIAAWRRGVSVGVVADGASPGIALGLAIGRIGDIINGEHWASACSGLAWCVRYTHPDTLGQQEFVHPAVVYDLLWCLVLCAAAIRLLPRWTGSRGRIFWLFLIGYGLDRFLISFLRVGDPEPLLGLRQDQLVGTIAMLVGAMALAFLSGMARRGKREPVPG